MEPGPYQCPNPENPYTLWGLVGKLRDDSDFAAFFAAQLKAANEGGKAAIACVESYLDPTDQELENLGIHESQWGSLRKCTDVGLLVIVTAKQKAPQIFP